jgi:hypothetical protein
MYPTPAKPKIITAQVEGSGTAPTLNAALNVSGPGKRREGEGVANQRKIATRLLVISSARSRFNVLADDPARFVKARKVIAAERSRKDCRSNAQSLIDPCAIAPIDRYPQNSNPATPLPFRPYKLCRQKSLRLGRLVSWSILREIARRRGSSSKANCLTIEPSSDRISKQSACWMIFMTRTKRCRPQRASGYVRAPL